MLQWLRNQMVVPGTGYLRGAAAAWVTLAGAVRCGTANHCRLERAGVARLLQRMGLLRIAPLVGRVPWAG
jgi:hypothetical protein